jgi:hypothetical protein
MLIKEVSWEGATLAPDDLKNSTPAWMCLTREGKDQKERRDKKNARLERQRARKRRPVQFMFSF